MNKISVDIDDIGKIVKALEELYKDLEKATNEITKDIADEGLSYLNKQYTNMYSDPNLTDINTEIRSDKDGYKIVSYGDDVVYAEFGTGDEGEKTPHPDKSKYSLDAYNSGPYIRDVSSLDKDSYTSEDLEKIGITSGKFWYYEKDGVGYYTQGVPAGKQMFNTFNHLRDKSIKEIVGKRGKEINDKFINAIKK